MQDDLAIWFAGKDFSTDWTSSRIPIFAESLSDRRERVRNVLEIGSWEGRSAVFFLNFFPDCKVTSIDTFAGSAETDNHSDWAALVPHCEQRFDANLAEYGPRVEKIKSSSGAALPRLATAFRRFDFIYVDGSHHSADVYSDATLSWPMLERGGVLAFDDYGWALMEAEAECPKLGTDAFLAGHEGQYRELYRGYQIIIEKV